MQPAPRYEGKKCYHEEFSITVPLARDATHTLLAQLESWIGLGLWLEKEHHILRSYSPVCMKDYGSPAPPPAQICPPAPLRVGAMAGGVTLACIAVSGLALARSGGKALLLAVEMLYGTFVTPAPIRLYCRHCGPQDGVLSVVPGTNSCWSYSSTNRLSARQNYSIVRSV